MRCSAPVYLAYSSHIREFLQPVFSTVYFLLKKIEFSKSENLLLNFIVKKIVKTAFLVIVFAKLRKLLLKSLANQICSKKITKSFQS